MGKNDRALKMIWQHQKRMSAFLYDLPLGNDSHSLTSCTNSAVKAYLVLYWMGRLYHSILVNYSKRISAGYESHTNSISSPLSQQFFHGLNTISEHKIGAHKYEQRLLLSKIYSINTFPSGITDIFMRSIIQTTKTPLLKEFQCSEFARLHLYLTSSDLEDRDYITSR